MSGSAQDKRNSGRVHITYDVDTGGARVKRELPFIIGVIGNFTGMKKTGALSERPFYEINSNKFDETVATVAPELVVEASFGRARLNFRKMKDFEPAEVANQVAQIKALRDLRARLMEFRDKYGHLSEEAAEEFKKILLDAEARSELSDEFGIGAVPPDAAAPKS